MTKRSQTETEGIDIVEVLDKFATAEWNEAISSRLESMSRYLSSDEWKKGIEPYLKSVLGHGIHAFLVQHTNSESRDYLRGFFKAIQLVLSLPANVERQIAAAEHKNQADAGPRDAGY